MKCQAKYNDIINKGCICNEEATNKITVTTFVPHLNNKKQVKTRCLCTDHARRFRNKLNHQIHVLNKNKSYIEESIT